MAKWLAAVLFGMVLGAGGLWWWVAQEPQSLGQATEIVQQVVSDARETVKGATNSTVPTATPVAAVIPVTSPTAEPTFAPVATPALAPMLTQTPTQVPTPSPTLTAPQILYLMDSGKITKEAAAAMLEQLNATSQAGSFPTTAATPMTIVSPGPTTGPLPNLRHLDEKEYMLELINAERAKAGSNPVVLGDNIAAQLHTESALTNCFSAHWGIDGLKPYMRYSLAGGYQSNGENGSGSDYCIKASERYRPIDSIRQEIREAMDGWMGSPGHRRNILDPQHKKVNIGIGWDRFNVMMYQHFEGDYVEYDRRPTIADGFLNLSGKTKNGVRFGGKRDLGVQIYYDPPPRPLTRGQVARTYCYDNGFPVASLREQLTDGSYWTEDQFTTTKQSCPNPYDVPADAPPARSNDEAHRLWQEAYNKSKSTPSRTITVPWITAQRWIASGETFAVQANINQVLTKHGDGVYSILVWGKINGEDTVISEYSIFHGSVPPDTYNPGQ